MPALRPDVPGAGPAASPRYGCGHGDEGGAIALRSAGPVDAAFYEHRLLAEQLARPLVTPAELTVTDSGVYAHGRHLGVLYRRLDEQTLLDATGADGRPIGPAM